MCLSTVYSLQNNEKRKICENIMSIQFEDNKIVCINILGVKTFIDGTIEKIDLMDNYIIIKENSKACI